MPLNFKKKWPCGNDCSCSLCLELQVSTDDPPPPLGFFKGRDKKKTGSKKKLKGAAPPPEPPNDNFILKRSMFDFRQMSMMELNSGSNIKKSLSYQEISRKLEASFQNHQSKQQKVFSTSNLINDPLAPIRPCNSSSQLLKAPEHRTVIYFGDSFRKPEDERKPKLIKVDGPKVEDDYHSRRLSEELQFTRQNSVRKSKNFSVLCQKAESFGVHKQALRPTKPAPPPPPSAVTAAEQNVVRQLKLALNDKSKPKLNSNNVQQIKVEGVTQKISNPQSVVVNDNNNKCDTEDATLPSFVESVINGVINIRIEDNYEVASKLVQSVHDRSCNTGIEFFDDDNDEVDDFDWSFVQEWRTRPSGNPRPDVPPYNKPQNGSGSSLISPGTQHIATSSPVAVVNGRIQSPLMATPAPKVAKEISLKQISGDHQSPNPNGNGIHKAGSVYIANSVAATHAISPKGVMMAEVLQPGKFTPQRAVVGKIASVDVHNGHALAKVQSVGPTRITVQSQPVKAQPAMVSSTFDQSRETRETQKTGEPNDCDQVGLDNVDGTVKPSDQAAINENGLPNAHASSAQKGPLLRTHHHNGAHDFQRLQRLQECHSSSDENRSSGHASMSDGHGSSSPNGKRLTGLGPLPEDRLAAGVTNRSTRSRSGNGRPRHRATPAKGPWAGGNLEDIKAAIQQLTMRSQTSTSTYSSLSAGSESSEPAVRRLGRYSSIETINTNVTSADEFVWVDSHNRLVELQHPPWSQHCVMRVIRSGRCREHSERVSAEAVPRLGYLMQRALVRIAREIQRLSSGLGLCAKHEVASAFKIVLCPALADSCIKACLRAAAMFQVPGDGAIKQSKSARAGLQLPVGRFYRWMVDARLGKFVHEYAAVYLSAGMENLLEEIFLHCLPADPNAALTASGLEHAIAGSGDLWGLLQPYAHLNAGRIASGALTMPRWASQSSIGSGSTTHTNPQGLEPCLLTTCVGSLTELKDLVGRAQQRSHHITLSHGALRALFYFMRCSQLEHNEGGSTISSSNNIQELCYERAYVVLPPLVEWLRVASAHAEYRHALLIDKDDVMQAARLLLPGVDCPPRPIVSDEDLPSKKHTGLSHIGPNHGSLSSNSSATSINIEDSSECGKRATTALAFKLMLSGRPELLIQALSLVPTNSRYDSLNHQGLTPLMVAAIRNDESAIQTLIEAGADVNVEVPTAGHQSYPAIHPETQHWTALTFAACQGNFQAVRLLLERGAHVEGGARLSEDKCTITPLQVASGAQNLEVVAFLLAHGAHAFLSTQQKDTLCFAGTAQRGCYSAISVAAAHGQRAVLRKLLSHPMTPGNREVLSLEEMLAEGDSSGRADRTPDTPPTLNKTQVKCLQEAMYHSAENNHLDITIELRTLGVPWTLHCWMHGLAAAHELRLDIVIDQLLQDFFQVCPDDYSQQFVTECLPLLFNIFRYSKKEATTLLLADIFSTCFGSEPIKPIKEPVLQPGNGSRIDPKFVNNPELSDVTFRVEGRIFYGHKIVLVTASPRLQSMLSAKVNEGNNTPTVQINDIRYHIFELVMQFLYSGGCNSLEVSKSDVLELMAAASFFQLEGLLRYTEAKCSVMVDIDNVVAMYIHAKVYNATKLMEYCQGFLLQNMMALLTYDDSVKRLMFAKKIPNHDVLNGLLQTLQNRIKTKRNFPPLPNSPGNVRSPLPNINGGNHKKSK